MLSYGESTWVSMPLLPESPALPQGLTCVAPPWNQCSQLLDDKMSQEVSASWKGPDLQGYFDTTSNSQWEGSKDLDLLGILMFLLTADGKVFSLYYSHMFCLSCTGVEVKLPVLGDPKHLHMHMT